MQHFFVGNQVEEGVKVSFVSYGGYGEGMKVMLKIENIDEEGKPERGKFTHFILKEEDFKRLTNELVFAYERNTAAKKIISQGPVIDLNIVPIPPGHPAHPKQKAAAAAAAAQSPLPFPLPL